jgi:hypothetical protein
MRLVVIESPLAGDLERNLRYARACMRHSLMLGEAPLASHLLYPQPGILRDEDPIERQWGIAAGLSWGKHADLVAVYFDLEISPGMQLGITRAKQRNQRIVYRQVPGWTVP